MSATSQTNLRLAGYLNGELQKDKSIESSLLNLEDHPLPLYYPKVEAEQGIPKAAHVLAQELKSANAFVFSAPEYNGSIPPILSNMIAWVSRSGKDWREAFNGKFVVVATHSGGGGQKVVASMRSQLEHLGAIVLPRTIVVNSFAPYKQESGEAIMQQLSKLVAAVY